MTKTYSNHSLDEDLKKKLLEIGQKELAGKLGITPSIPAVIRYLVKQYDMTHYKKGTKL